MHTFAKDVFPKDWKNPKPAEIYDLVIIGGGPGGIAALMAARELGARVAIVEKEHLGGECLSYGCMPSKALIRSSRVAAEVRDAADFGIEVPKNWKVNFPAIMRRVHNKQSTLSPGDSPPHFKKLGVDVFLGTGHFTGSNTLEVAGQTLRFKKALISTGTQPVRLAAKGVEEAGYLTNQNVFKLTSLPSSLAVIGAGPIGCELAQAFARLGSKVTLITRGATILPRDDRTATERLEKVMQKEGVQILFNTQVERVEKKGRKRVLYLDRKSKSIAVDEILIAIGRLPAVEGLDLERAGVVFDLKKGVEANDFFQTSNPNIYTSGDVSSPYKFTHISQQQGKMAVHNALNGNKLKRSSVIIPWCTFTDPEIAHIGVQESAAGVQTALVEMKNTGRAVLDGETTGFVKIHVKEGSDQIVGATIMARHAGDMISEIAVAIASQKGVRAIADAIHTFPTQAEAIREAAVSIVQAQSKKSESSLRRTA